MNPIRPAHYHSRDESGIECSDAQRAMLGLDGYRAYLAGMVIKYTWRHADKNGLEDLRKARQCIDMLIGEKEDEESDK